jgi:hypothetical protein
MVSRDVGQKRHKVMGLGALLSPVSSTSAGVEKLAIVVQDWAEMSLFDGNRWLAGDLSQAASPMWPIRRRAGRRVVRSAGRNHASVAEGSRRPIRTAALPSRIVIG